MAHGAEKVEMACLENICEILPIITASLCFKFCVVLQSSVVPKCGRMVGFNASNYHGVQAVQSGQRCAVAMWFTMDPSHREEAHDTLYQVLDDLEAARASQAAKPRVEL